MRRSILYNGYRFTFKPEPDITNRDRIFIDAAFGRFRIVFSDYIIDKGVRRHFIATEEKEEPIFNSVKKYLNKV